MTNEELTTAILEMLKRAQVDLESKHDTDGIKVVLREDGSGVIDSVTWIVSDSRVIYDFDLLAEFVDRYGPGEEGCNES